MGNKTLWTQFEGWKKDYKWVDLTRELSVDTPHWSGFPDMVVEVPFDYPDGFFVHKYTVVSQYGTHIDAPYHFLNDGNTVEQIPLEYFVGTCYVTHRDGELTANDAEEIMQEAKADNASERILIGGNVTVTTEAAKVFAEYGIKLIGNKGLSIGPVDAPMEVHKILLSANVCSSEFNFKLKPP